MSVSNANGDAAFGANDEADRADMLVLVQEGMQVYDSTDTFVGRVGEVRFGIDVDAAAPAREIEPGDGALIEALRDAFTGRNDGERSEMIKRLNQSGFVKLAGSGLLRGRRYILPEQVDYVDSEGVHLNLLGDKLLAD